ncbi:MAG: hypothetical protein LYZ70_06735 [Nitrososphaerales archaeon]|nr:hypothetical protein [Nitrososphaerales archaeon]
MNTDFMLNILDAALIIGVALPSLYMATRVNQPKLRILTILLSSFLIFHGLYHATSALGTLGGLGFLGYASDVFFEPFGYLLLLFFAVYYWRSAS